MTLPYPIPSLIQGLIREVGGDSAIFGNVSLELLWGESRSADNIRALGQSNTMNFQIRAKAQEYMNPGENTVTILAEADQSRFLNGASKDVEILGHGSRFRSF